MACFVVPLAEALIISAVKAGINKSYAKETVSDAEKTLKLEKMNTRVGILEKLLYGGCFLLMIEHIYHGEILFNIADLPEVLHEMATVGVTMSILVTAVWAIGCGIFAAIKNKKKKETAKECVK